MSDSDFDSDDNLRALLRGGDPAGSLSPADPAGLAILLEDIMSADLDVRPDADEGSRATGTHGRNRLTWLVAAAAAAMIAAGGGFAISGLGGDSPPQAGPKPSVSAPDPNAPLAGQTTQLTAKVPDGKCVAEPTAAMLAGYDQAFEGTVTSIEGDTVTLEATEVYQGEVGETVEVKAPQAPFQAMIQQVQFQVGGTYLVSTFDGAVSMCGFSGPASGSLQKLFTEAFVR
jgi:hypothetical protein